MARPPAERTNKATLPVAPLIGATAALGWIGFQPDEDGTCRSMLPAAAYAPAGSRDAAEVWSLPFAMASLLGHRVESRPGMPAAAGLTLDNRRVRLDEEGHFLLRFHGGEGTYREFPFMKVLQAALQTEGGQTPADAGPADEGVGVLGVQFASPVVIGLRLREPSQ